MKSFAMSGCGWLAPFHFGVLSAMKEGGYLTCDSLVHGTSGGSISALVAVTNIDPKDALLQMIEMGERKETFKDIDKALKLSLSNLLPSDAVEKCNTRLHVVVTQVKPTFNHKPIIINKFESINHLIDSVAASCFIPFYSSRRFNTSIHSMNGYRYIDGGLLAFMPPQGDICVSPFPATYLKPLFNRLPHIHLHPYDYPIHTLLKWSLVPPSGKYLSDLYNRGFQLGNEYIEKDQRRL